MAQKKSLSTSTPNFDNQTAEQLSDALRRLIGFVKTAKKHDFKLSTHSFYADKARHGLLQAKRAVLALGREFPAATHPDLASNVRTIGVLIDRVELSHEPAAILSDLNAAETKLHTEIADEIIAAQSATTRTGSAFIPLEILKPGINQKILDEANRAFSAGCPNGCAALLRRLLEVLIIEGFEHHHIESKIKAANGEYEEMKALVGKAIAEPALHLSQGTRKALPDLKILGDKGAHGRGHLVRDTDLTEFRVKFRFAIEELAKNS